MDKGFDIHGTCVTINSCSVISKKTGAGGKMSFGFVELK
jgi:hypothetical protein